MEVLEFTSCPLDLGPSGFHQKTMTDFLNNILMLCWLIAILYTLFDTDALVEWGGFLRLKFLKFSEYSEIKKSALGKSVHTYVDFLIYKYGKYFIIRLLTCPTCFSVWLNILALGVFSSSVGGVRMLGFNILATWLLYFTLRKVLQLLA